MYQKGDIVRYNDQDYVVLDVNYKKKEIHIGIPDKDNISKQRIWLNIKKVTTCN